MRGALGPYLNVFLVTQQHWSQSAVGLVTSVGGLLGLAVQTPIGGIDRRHPGQAGIDRGRLMVLSAGAVTIFAAPIFWPVMIANCLIAIVGDVFGPAVAALTLGLYPRKALGSPDGPQFGLRSWWQCRDRRSRGFGRLGVFTARGLFARPVFAVLAGFAVLSIPAGAIDHVRARGGEKEHDGEPQPSGLKVLLTCRPLLLYAGCTMLFHFANAPLLPLVGQKLALRP